ncbi:unnamed protein product [Cylicocyclus nassatus]|uniref:Uncharacterized protein n=1 Tax=Cylicocyclus nassatus TaxID=53992 RepID=A0AA36GWI6_CYLNA|nr:unnamed protein product [Cylicocyclus nassatus]CAJ0599612.1 unnamed protein product [Cylicocyclus nassatus]
MRPELRQQQNAKRAELLRKARQRDEELCHLTETCSLDTLDEETRRAVAEAQMRRVRRAEQARAKYYRMNRSVSHGNWAKSCVFAITGDRLDLTR